MFVHSADKLAEMRTKFHIIQAKLIMSVLCFTVHWQGDTKVGACMVPLDGDENSFSYNSRTCEHILAEAVGRDQKKSARWVSWVRGGAELHVSSINVSRAMCRKWKRINKRKLEKVKRRKSLEAHSKYQGS